jgi:hypothetical protein
MSSMTCSSKNAEVWRDHVGPSGNAESILIGAYHNLLTFKMTISARAEHAICERRSSERWLEYLLQTQEVTGLSPVPPPYLNSPE